ncbi:MAG: 50S ribosomal protein L24 [Candidatus Magasanikbacteria bacterium RIFOXYC2_FULL_40_16]|uniref:Large ribosomal subunit protein uL24 n=3 Tax=Candidatus Magasanikiibacteriota TaxID=1752731 RepID=A0A1F6NGS2_9BACT|nr:MAG: 50S ribosomal protein L24 [Candidatus Magasanikbacteria bacterium RIFOXYA2_FULL_40_20]OGH83226.1 MAG: 50S ribosomal protein L24 [Candidatus Magasanikbacteria bacterium RIFOXYB1_FULL_40_15]OGH85158.1 MAG: 50S ribosomal protein L24 [Candidatus Magasanikbacteria bacterium RIFOXYB2_FULL_40_13]OGH87076.1 MAG: 50S ribosomal protein L24 [Candidatus Magasanikbacteria bacterium RIFOXYA1_FULL_40_8]OGH89509.1 MAG: 50S ribosomal protein L24 [Candidatus Magasanikbacteria bacterium RIFOXYC2_FULL_40_1
MKIKTGDNVKVLSGRDRGKTGKVIQVLKSKKNGQNYAVVEGVNLRKKHLKTRKAGEKGQTIELSFPIHISNVMVIDSNTKKTTRVGYKVEGKEKKRISKKSGEFI